jgi:hypothetical protein
VSSNHRTYLGTDPHPIEKRGRATTKPGTLLRKHIRIKTNQWNESSPGFLEADTVAHCGDSTAGMYANTIDFVDIATGWTEQRAIWGKGEAGVLEQIKDVEPCLTFPLLGFDCDNGSEFLNHHLNHHQLRHFTEKKVSSPGAGPTTRTTMRILYRRTGANCDSG